MGIDWKDVLRGIGGGAKGVLGVMQQEDAQQHDKDVIRIRARLDNVYQERRDRASRAHDKELTEISHNFAVKMQDRSQEIADRVAAYGSNEVGMEIEGGLRNPDGFQVASAMRKIQVMNKISQQAELDENDMKVVGTFSPQAQMMFGKDIALGAKSRQEMEMSKGIAESMIKLRKMQEAELRSQIDFRNAGSMTPQQRMQIKAGIQGKISNVLESDIVQRVETRLAGLDANQKAAYLAQFAEENPGQYMAYRGSLKHVEILQGWDATLNASDPKFIEELMQQLLDEQTKEDAPTEQPAPKKEGFAKTTIDKMKDVYGDIIPDSAQNVAKDIVQRTPIGATAKELLKTQPAGADMSNYDIAVLAKKRKIDPKKVMSYKQFETKRDSKTLKAGDLVAIKGKLWKLIKLRPNPKFEEIE